MVRSLLYLLLFFAVQHTVALASALAGEYLPKDTAFNESVGYDMAIEMVGYAVLLALFMGFKWCRVSRHYVRTRPWGTMVWTVLLGLGMLAPLTWIEEFIPESWRIDVAPEAMQMFLKSQAGYFVLCMLGPLVEETVFRGAIIRALQEWVDGRVMSEKARMWLPIIISALFFAGIHMNPAQIPHALIVGVLLGWIFVRTDSIALCCLIHWINNSVCYALAKMFPLLPADARLEDYLGNSSMAVTQAVVCSLMIALPALYQLNRLMKKD